MGCRQVAWLVLNGWIYAWELEAEFLVLSTPQPPCGNHAVNVSLALRWFASAMLHGIALPCS